MAVLLVLEAASAPTADVVEQVRLEKAFELIDGALNEFPAKHLLDSPIEVHTKIAIQQSPSVIAKFLIEDNLTVATGHNPEYV